MYDDADYIGPIGAPALTEEPCFRCDGEIRAIGHELHYGDGIEYVDNGNS